MLKNEIWKYVKRRKNFGRPGRVIYLFQGVKARKKQRLMTIVAITAEVVSYGALNDILTTHVVVVTSEKAIHTQQE